MSLAVNVIIVRYTCGTQRKVLQRDEPYEVIAFDWPGIGYRDAWRGAWQLPRVYLIGLDMGAQPALVFAAHPQRASVNWW